MVKVFSFTLFGSQDKYCKGLLKNITLIEQKFPEWQVWVYCGDEIPEDILVELNDHACVRLIPTHQTGMLNKFYRFFAIDDPRVEICLIRDADSRIYERDEACIRQFLASDKLVHIIRDHPNHHHTMMAGMWGIKTGTPLPDTVSGMCQRWIQSRPASDFWSDTLFLCEALYPFLRDHALIHDETQAFESLSQKVPFPTPLDEKHFVGQVYEFDSNGYEAPKYPYSI